MALLDAPETPATWPARAFAFYEQHERGLDLLFFAAGYGLDILTVQSGVDHGVLAAQQVVYLAIIATLLHLEFHRRARPESRLATPLERLWEYRSLLLHFCLGALANLYSIFFVMSASTLASALFVGALFLAIFLNETRAVRESGMSIVVALFVLGVCCFFAVVTPMAFGHVGVVPFAWSMVASVAAIGLFYGLLRLRIGRADLHGRLLGPAAAVMAGFLASYLAGIIPPVPIALRDMGVYHRVERDGDVFALYRDPGSRRAWLLGNTRFVARPGDAVYVFAAIYAPARFDDEVVMRWSHHDLQQGWAVTDTLPLEITGGREAGFRAYTVKRNFSPGDWRVAVETSDGRVIGRLSFSLVEAPASPRRVLLRETY